jgi:hypothetical protein
VPSAIVPKDGSYSREPVERLPTWNGRGQQDLGATNIMRRGRRGLSCPNHRQWGQTLTCGRPPRDLRSQATQASDAQCQYSQWGKSAKYRRASLDFVKSPSGSSTYAEPMPIPIFVGMWSCTEAGRFRSGASGFVVLLEAVNCVQLGRGFAILLGGDSGARPCRSSPPGGAAPETPVSHGRISFHALRWQRSGRGLAACRSGKWRGSAANNSR